MLKIESSKTFNKIMTSYYVGSLFCIYGLCLFTISILVPIKHEDLSILLSIITKLIVSGIFLFSLTQANKTKNLKKVKMTYEKL